MSITGTPVKAFCAGSAQAIRKQYSYDRLLVYAISSLITYFCFCSFIQSCETIPCRNMLFERSHKVDQQHARGKIILTIYTKPKGKTDIGYYNYWKDLWSINKPQMLSGTKVISKSTKNIMF